MAATLRHLTRVANVIIRPDWFIPERCVTPEAAFQNRRDFLRRMVWTGAGLLAAPLTGCSPGDNSKKPVPASTPAADPPAAAPAPTAKGYPAQRNAEFNPGWPLTNERVAGTYNNFYEFSATKDRVHQLTGRFVTSPWPVEIAGLAEQHMTVDAGELAEMFGLEERVYRFRCVEAWAMIVPWTGFQLSKLLEKVKPKPEAKFVKFVTALKRDQMPGPQRMSDYPWPYTEGLRLDEAMNPLVLVTTGIYGKPLPKQHGAPLRLIVPWKYGYKGAKSIVRIELTDSQPETFWETLAPHEYPFESNVNPAVPHPRWSQATERMIDTDDRVRTQPFNGYGKYVAQLYRRG
jgi:sulfoxide reductase catalytic subunit YedY